MNHILFFPYDIFIDIFDRVVTRTTRSESVTIRLFSIFPFWFMGHKKKRFFGSVFKGMDTYREKIRRWFTPFLGIKTFLFLSALLSKTKERANSILLKGGKVFTSNIFAFIVYNYSSRGQEFGRENSNITVLVFPYIFDVIFQTTIINYILQLIDLYLHFPR